MPAIEIVCPLLTNFDSNMTRISLRYCSGILEEIILIIFELVDSEEIEVPRLILDSIVLLLLGSALELLYTFQDV